MSCSFVTLLYCYCFLNEINGDVSHCQILSPDKTEWRLISATLCGWRRCFVADQLWYMTRIREEEKVLFLRYSASDSSVILKSRLWVVRSLKLAPFKLWSWYTGRWWVGCYIWYSEEGTGSNRNPSRPLLAVPNVTAHPSTASVPITVLLYNGPSLCGFNVSIKGLTKNKNKCVSETQYLLYGWGVSR